MALTPIPPFPAIGDPNFNTLAYDWATFMAGTGQDELDALVTAVDADATAAAASAATATTQAGLATTNGAAQVALAADQVALATTQAGLATTNGAAQVALAAAQVTLATTQAGIATTQAGLAAASAVTAVSAPGTSATSTTSLTIATGTQSLTIQTAKALVVGMTVKIANTASPTNWMLGDITSYDSGTGALVVNVTSIQGSGAGVTTWTVSLSAPGGSSAGISQVTTATTATTLTSTPTLLQITPSDYGVPVTLPDATTCAEGGPLHIIDNKGAFSVRLVDSAGALKGFVPPGEVSHVSLEDNSTAAGVWAVSGVDRIGVAARLLTTNMSVVRACVDIGGSREVLIASGVSNANIYGVVFDRSTGTFGSVTLIRTGSFSDSQAILSAANQVLVASCATTTTAFEAVTLSISGTTITVNTAATATLSANIGAPSYLIAVGGSFVLGHALAGPARELRAMTVSGTTVTIGSAVVLDGTAGGLLMASANHVIAVSTLTTSIYTKPYLVSGSTLTAGTGTTTTGGTMTSNKFAALGSRWYLGYNDGGSTIKGAVVSLDTTGNGTTTISTVTLMSAGALTDAIVVGSDKVLVLNNQATNNYNILTDTAGTASAGTAVTISSATNRHVLYANGIMVVSTNSAAPSPVVVIDCSGASPVLSKSFAGTGGGIFTASTASDSYLVRNPALIFATNFASSYGDIDGSRLMAPAVSVQQENLIIGSKVHRPYMGITTNVFYAGRSDSERWGADANTVIFKMECAA